MSTYVNPGDELSENNENVASSAKEAVSLPRLLAEGRELDLAFVDGNHRFESVFLDLFYSGRLLRDGGIVFVDDTQLPGVRRAVDFYLANLGWATEDGGTEGAHEWLVIRTGPRDAFFRPYAEFVDFQKGTADIDEYSIAVRRHVPQPTRAPRRRRVTTGELVPQYKTPSVGGPGGTLTFSYGSRFKFQSRQLLFIGPLLRPCLRPIEPPR